MWPKNSGKTRKKEVTSTCSQGRYLLEGRRAWLAHPHPLLRFAFFFLRVARPQPHHALVSYALTKEERHAETCLFAHFPSVTFTGAGQGDAPIVSDSRREHEKR